MSNITITINRHIFQSLGRNIARQKELIKEMEDITPGLYQIMHTDCPMKELFIEADKIWNKLIKLKAKEFSLLDHLIDEINNVGGDKNVRNNKRIPKR